MKGTIHQPEHLPWLGFFDKVSQADIFVMLDNVQFRKNYFQNRNRIKTKDGTLWLTVPVEIKGKFGQLINEVRIAEKSSWKEKCWKSMEQNYRKAAYFGEYADFFSNLYSMEWKNLLEINENIIRFLLKALSIETKLVKASEINAQGEKGDLILDICQKTGCSTYISGVSGKDYLDIEKFRKEGVNIEFQEFYHPIYDQLYGPFIPCLSVIDLLFNHGNDSMKIIKDQNVPRLKEIFK